MATKSSVRFGKLDWSRASGEQADGRVSRHAKSFQLVLDGKVECPECGDMGPHDDNGRTGDERSFCCRKCGTHFDEVEL